MIRLARATDGRLIILSSEQFPADVSRVEYYRDLKLIMLNYGQGDEESELMPCEITAEVDHIIRQSPEVLVIAMAEKGSQPRGYEATLVQIGL